MPRQRLPIDYDEDEIRFFMKYTEHRSEAKPKECTGNGWCWVVHGPLGITNRGICKQCKQRPHLLIVDSHKVRYKR